MTFGRIGTDGRTRAYVFDGEARARTFMAHCLRRRRSSPKRISAPYVERQSVDDDAEHL